jgi:transcription antitermination factor NusG
LINHSIRKSKSKLVIEKLKNFMAKRSIMEKQWYVLYTKPHQEKRVSENLTRKKIENFLPLNRIVGDNIVSKKIAEEPLFKCYVFIKVLKSHLDDLRKLQGVVNVVYWFGEPVTVDDIEINILRNFLNSYINVTVEKTTMRNGTFVSDSNIEQDGSVVTVKNKKANVILSSLGYKITAEIETSHVRIIPSTNVIRRPKLPVKIFSQVNFNNFFKD